jgi:hypothetical protein
MPVLLSDEELNALSGITDIQYRLYISGIRRYMDYKTGITGIKRKISYQSLSEEIYVDPKQGNKNGGARSKDQVKRALKALEAAGLITMHSIVTKIKKQLILKCVLAITDDSAQNKAALLPPHSAAPQPASIEKSENTIKIDVLDERQEKTRPTTRQFKIEKAAPPPISDKLNNNNNTREPVDNFSRQQFLDLLAAKRFPLAYLADARTNHMLNLWEEANITQEEAKAAIQHGDNEVLSRKGRVTVPWYYQDIPFQLRGDLNHLQEQKHETTSAGQSKQPSSYEQLRERRAKWREKCEQEDII